jgi:hypothetical protein
VCWSVCPCQGEKYFGRVGVCVDRFFPVNKKLLSGEEECVLIGFLLSTRKHFRSSKSVCWSVFPVNKKTLAGEYECVLLGVPLSTKQTFQGQEEWVPVGFLLSTRKHSRASRSVCWSVFPCQGENVFGRVRVCWSVFPCQREHDFGRVRVCVGRLSPVNKKTFSGE